ncbi:hypothetical protein RA307_19265 [Xanthobacteraceae bacterium Astr-EGSB]|uniref:hypothetical protein n=1 Tax=Astrobacterium formosum TaxID=3069710 RepID=UPI0027AE86FC|nr:hypothetical protein [Xanthobacteraceae bacterium Astr-EGSB]
MDSILRLILRLIVVPLGAVVAVCIGTLVVVAAHWGALDALARADPAAQEEWFFALVVAGPVLTMLFSMMAAYAFLAAAIGALVAEFFAVRSWIYHALNGGLGAWIGWALMADMRAEYADFADPKILVAAGLAGGLAYWLVAGWSAGFWKPVGRANTVPSG